MTDHNEMPTTSTSSSSSSVSNPLANSAAPNKNPPTVNPDSPSTGQTDPYALEIDDYDLDTFVEVARQFPADQYGFVVTPNVDHLIRLFETPSFRTLYAASTFVLLDSRFAARVLKWQTGVRYPVCTGSDLTAALLRKTVRPDDRIVLIGCSAGQAQSLSDEYRLSNLAHHNPPMGFVRDAEAVERCLEFIESHSPFRYCFLAVGSSQQEVLAAALQRRGKARGLALCVGAAIDFLTGVERRAPRWIQSLALEWLFRLVQNPRRLFYRYAIRGPRFFAHMRRARVRLRAPTLKAGQ